MALTATHKKTKFGVGDVIAVHQKLEKEKGRIQIFEGMVIAIGGHGNGKSFTIRRIGSTGVGIERIFPLNSPTIEKIEIKRKGTKGVTQAKLYYTRDKSKKEIEKIFSREARR